MGSPISHMECLDPVQPLPLAQNKKIMYLYYIKGRVKTRWHRKPRTHPPRAFYDKQKVGGVKEEEEKKEKKEKKSVC